MDRILRTGQEIDGFQVKEYCKTYGLNNAKSYRVVDAKGEESLMKIIIDGCASAEFSQAACEVMRKRFSLPRLLKSGALSLRSIDYRYIVREMSEGTRLSESLEEGTTYTWEEAVIIILQVLTALATLHSSGILHNDVRPSNVILDDCHVTLVGLGHLSAPSPSSRSVQLNDLDPWFMAPETIRRRFSVRSDIFSAGALMYALLFGIAPWSDQGVEAPSVNALREVRRIPVRKICTNRKPQLTNSQMDILCRMLAPDFDERFGKIEEVIGALADSLKNDEGLLYDGAVAQQDEETACSLVCEEADEAADIPRGFSAVAGMDSLKQMLTDEVMYVLQNPDKVKRYRLKVPNGMLLYGPPGCGKTFIAEKFAQESRLNFMMVKASDIGSSYVHGTQGKIKDLFDEASAKAPTILCLDELDGMAPDRTRLTSEAVSGEVNEFLSQLNNCSDRGIFVIGTTNRPNMIDPAIIRSGRMDHLVYIPMPDKAAREDLFRIHLGGRPCDDDIDIRELAGITEGYVASDIELVVNKAALASAKRDLPISQKLLKEMVAMTRRSVSESDRLAYEDMYRQMVASSRPQERRRIGFLTTNNQ